MNTAASGLPIMPPILPARLKICRPTWPRRLPRSLPPSIMILDGNTHGDGAILARYMQTGKDGEIATVVQFRAPEFFGNDPVKAFALMQGMAEASTKSTKP